MSPTNGLRLGRWMVWALGMLATVVVQGAGDPEWRWSHPLPHGNNVADLLHRSGTYLHVTDHGGIYTSTNRLVWERRPSGTFKDLRAAAHLGNRLLITGQEGTVLWSDDGRTFVAGALQGSTTDWLEGVAATTNRAVAVGDRGAIYTTSDGISWGRVGGVAITEWLSGVAYGAGLFVAVGDSGLVASSPNGTNWTRRSSGTASDLLRVVFGDGRFLAVGRGGVVLTSVNGTSWSADTATGLTNALFAAAAQNGERLVAGDGAFLLRKPPAAWVDQSSTNLSPSPVPGWSWSAVVWDGQRYLAGGRTGVLVESWRTNAGSLSGETFWYRNDESPRNLLFEVARLGRTYLAVGDVGTVMSSANGIDWSADGAPVTPDVTLYGLGGSPEEVVAVGSAGTVLRSLASEVWAPVTNSFSAGGGAHTLVTTNRLSLLGGVWEQASPVTTNTLQGVARNGVRWVLTGAQGTVLTSTNGFDWRASVVAGAGFLSSVAAFNEGFVASGAGGRIYTSPDGTSWTQRVTGTTNWVYRVRNLGGVLVGVGQNGTLLVSTDGTAWAARASGSTEFLTDVCRAGRYVQVCGTGGTMLRSTNLVDWQAVSLPTGKSLFGLAGDGSQVITVGAEGVILRAIGDPSGRPVGFAAHSLFGAAGETIEGFVFEGSPEAGFRLESADQPLGWSTSWEGVLDTTGAAATGRVAAELSRFHRTAAGP